LIGIYAGNTAFVMDPISFIQNPLLWPECLSKYMIHYTFGPTFSYSLVSRKIRESGKTFDLSCLYRIDIAAEPIHEKIVNEIKNDWKVNSKTLTGVAASGDLALSASYNMHSKDGMANLIVGT
jgi:hypothetical protein